MDFADNASDLESLQRSISLQAQLKTSRAGLPSEITCME